VINADNLDKTAFIPNSSSLRNAVLAQVYHCNVVQAVLSYVKYGFNPLVTSGMYMSTYKESFQVRWDNSIPLFLHAAIYLDVSLFR
jgi:hypothetical protein